MKPQSKFQTNQVCFTLSHRKLSPSIIEIFDLISSQNWNVLKETLKKDIFLNHRNIVPECTGTCCHTCTSDHSILHFACQFRPPYNIFKLLLKANPKSVTDLDCKGRYPLHIACKHGCSPDIIRKLVSKNIFAAKKPDLKNRTPLILAMKSYVRRSGLDWEQANRNIFEIATVLHELDPISLLIKDIKGFTALNYARNQELSIIIVEYIQEKYDHAKVMMQYNQDYVMCQLKVNNMNHSKFVEFCKTKEKSQIYNSKKEILLENQNLEMLPQARAA